MKGVKKGEKELFVSATVCEDLKVLLVKVKSIVCVSVSVFVRVFFTGWHCATAAVEREKKVIDQLRQSWQTLRTLLGVARSGHHSGSKRNNNNSNSTNHGTIVNNKKHQLEEEEEPVIKMGSNQQPSRSGMPPVAVAPTAAATTTSNRISSSRTTKMLLLLRMPTRMKSAIGSVSRIRIASRRIRCAAGAPSRKAYATTGAAGRNLPERPTCLESAAIGVGMKEM